MHPWRHYDRDREFHRLMILSKTIAMIRAAGYPRKGRWRVNKKSQKYYYAFAIVRLTNGVKKDAL